MTPHEWAVFRGDIIHAAMDVGGEIGGRVLKRYLDQGTYHATDEEIRLALNYLSERGYITITEVKSSPLTTEIICITAAGQDIATGEKKDHGVSV